MKKNILDTPIEYLQGVGPQRAEVLKSEFNIFTFNDLLYFFPFRFIDKSKYHTSQDINPNISYIQIIGKLSSFQEIKQKRGGRLTAFLEDQYGKIELIWFKNIHWIKKGYKTGRKYVVYGKPTLYKNRINIVHPEMELVEKHQKSIQSNMQPVYHSNEKLQKKGLNSNGINKLLKNLLPQVLNNCSETLSSNLMEKLKLVNRKQALQSIHFPCNQEELQKAQFYLKFEELFFIQISLIKNKLINQNKIKGFVFKKIGNYFNHFYNNSLSFELTNAQKKVIKEIRIDVKKNFQMNRLLQGDVGSGKTVVALMSILIALDNGFQACIMAPTEILATQHFNTINKFLKKSNIICAILTGSVKKNQKTKILNNLKKGKINIIVGTHALIEDNVQFKNLGIAVIDEQHRFGVEQRSKLWSKNVKPPHILVMTATPIPRTLAMTLYGDLDISIIDELPSGRKPIKTIHLFENKRLQLTGFLRDQIKKGKQVYIVYPLIDESSTLDYNYLMDGYASLERDFPKPKYHISIVHGRMKAEEKEYEMNQFLNKKSQLMLATTVIEVGIDIPNANVMVIESSERFGLSQLHQLRGRVGRGDRQSYCILLSSYKLTEDAKIRLKTMVETNDGFKIADVDLKLRGPGDLMGTQQSGLLNLKIADLSKDNQILKIARASAIEILKEDGELSLTKNKKIKSYYNKIEKNKFGYGRIS